MTAKYIGDRPQPGSRTRIFRRISVPPIATLVPHKNDLDLGRRLALAFVNRELPDDADTVAAFFRRRGAYRRFKELLNARGMLQQWFDFESRATEKALRAWCEENGIQLVDG